jgi:hypothetical protein
MALFHLRRVYFFLLKPMHISLKKFCLASRYMSSAYAHFFKRLTPHRHGDSAMNEDIGSDGSMTEQEQIRAHTLNAYLECDSIDEYNFQVQAALLSTKVLKLLEKEEHNHQKMASKLRHFSRTSFASQSSGLSGLQSSPTSSGLFPTVARTRSSSWISTQSFRGTGPVRSPAASYMDGPLLDKILEGYSPENPVASHEIIKMMNLLTNLHSYCPETNSVGAPMGATCTVSDYSQVIASPEAMTRLVIMIRDVIETRAPTPLISSTVPPNGRLIVCGDTHAQLQDVMWVFFKNGVPSPTNIYVFNGDICDRGGHALEIFLILFLFKLNHYNSVHIIRGNHEDDYCNIYYGFLAELKHKFGPLPGGTMHTEFLRLFYSMPLACLIDSWMGLYKCNVTGAIIELSSSDGTSPRSEGQSPKSSGSTEVILRRKDASSGHRAYIKGEDLWFEKRTANRFLNGDGQNIIMWGESSADSWEYMSPRILVLHGGIPVPPSQSSAPSASVLLRHFKDLPHRMKIPPAPKTVLEQWMYQILWSDPAETDGPRGRGTPFFAHHTKSFADANNLAAVIRAHQVPANQRGVSFHHKQRLVTIFTASNYCGTSQNYGGVAIFTPTLFPQLAINRTLFEHWAPPLSLIRDIMSKHQNATQDVRMFIAHEIETERAPLDRASAGNLNHLEQKVAEYVTSLIVHHKRLLYTALNSKAKGHMIAVKDWMEVCNAIIGHHFPWRSLLSQLEIDVLKGDCIDFVGFLNRFKAGVRLGDSVIDTWEPAVVRGFFHELVSRDLLLQNALVAEMKNGPRIAPERLKEILLANCPAISPSQAGLFCQGILEKSSDGSIEVSAVFQVLSEYIRSYFSLIEAAPDAAPSESIVQVGRDAIDFFVNLRLAIVSQNRGSPGDAILRFFTQVLGGGGEPDKFSIPIREASARLEKSLGQLGLGQYKGIATNSLQFVAIDENEISPNGDIDLTLVRFYAACYIDGTPSGQAVRNRIAEHAAGAIYFHRNALRCACVHLDKSRCGEIDRHSFQRAFNALNSSLEQEWRLSKNQQRCVIEYLRWQFSDSADSIEESEMELVSKSIEAEDKLLVIEYDIFLEYVSQIICVYFSTLVRSRYVIVKE